jgi:hypothetical protein
MIQLYNLNYNLDYIIYKLKQINPYSSQHEPITSPYNNGDIRNECSPNANMFPMMLAPRSVLQAW